MLQAGVRTRNDALVQNGRSAYADPLDVEFVTFDEFEKAAQQPVATEGADSQERYDDGSFGSFMLRRGSYDPSSTVVLVLVSEPALSSFSDACRIACTSLKTAQMILAEDATIRLYLVIQSDHPSFTGVDAIAALLFGVSGIIEERALVDEEILQEILAHKVIDRRYRSMLVLGNTLDRIRGIKGVVEDWDNDFEADPTLDLPCWKASMALAQLEKLEPISTGGSVFGFVNLAQALNFAVHKTSFSYTIHDLRRVLSTLAGRWLGTGHESPERVKLPDYARKHGFPSHMPVIEGILDSEMMRFLYNAIKNIDITGEQEAGYGNYSLVRLRMKEYPRMLKNRLAQVNGRNKSSKEATHASTR